MARLHRDSGEVVRIRIPFAGRSGRETVLLTGARSIEQVLMRTDDFRTSGVAIHGPPGSAQKRLRLGIVRANGEEHRKLRKAYAGYFERAAFRDLPSRILPVVRDEVRSWPSDRHVDLPPLMGRLVRRMAVSALFPDGDQDESMRIAAMIEQHARAGFAKGVLAFPFNLPGTPYRRLLSQAERVESAIIDWANAYPGGRGAPNLMDAVHDVVGAKRGEADARVAAQIWTLLGASFETSATTLVWTLYLLAQHPEWAGRIRAEASRVLGAAEPAPDALLDLPVLEMVIRESMRVLTPVPYQRRISVRDVQLGERPSSCRRS
jgi:cytochrome P450